MIASPSSDTLPEFRVRSALPKDVAPFAAVFPPMFHYPSESRLFIVEDGMGKPRGGGFIMFAPASRGPAETVCDLHVFSPGDYEPVGNLLLALFENLCRARNRKILLPIKPAPRNSPLGELLTMRGFRTTRALHTYSVGIDALLADFEPVYTRLAARNKVSHEARVIPLREAPYVATRELVRATIGTHPLVIEQQLGDRLFDQELSKVIEVGTTLVGTILVRLRDGTPEIVYLTIEPGRRNSWIYTTLCCEFLRQAKAAGHQTVLLKTFNCSIMHSAERAGAVLLGEESNYRLELL